TRFSRDWSSDVCSSDLPGVYWGDCSTAAAPLQAGYTAGMELNDDKMQRRPRGRGIYLLPNLFTTGGLFGGFFAIIAASQGRIERSEERRVGNECRCRGR